jgi:hypothetical protein
MFLSLWKKIYKHTGVSKMLGQTSEVSPPHQNKDKPSSMYIRPVFEVQPKTCWP